MRRLLAALRAFPGLERLRALLAALRARIRPRRIEAPEDGGLTAVEYEAVTLIAYEGQGAYARAQEQARYCRRAGSESGFRFWSQVADEVALRTRGHIRG